MCQSLLLVLHQPLPRQSSWHAYSETFCTLQSRAFVDAWLGGLANLTTGDVVPWEQAAATDLLNSRADLRAGVSLLNASYLPSL